MLVLLEGLLIKRGLNLWRILYKAILTQGDINKTKKDAKSYKIEKRESDVNEEGLS
ncbi:hypothetical protein [Borrelia sp. RT1S]|uniref:hypothetical protein n=1 Tax=Borrelia sp. RT1S TaxID=2898580 RepID=UPI001E3EADEE|nr:hypothetical protein [Borrelia sp. RT1S]UGQ17735.1 hypothetical protein LSO05_04725 [Borrelia sp. RT1S]